LQMSREKQAKIRQQKEKGGEAKEGGRIKG
jgi:hypothetical protein